MKVLVAEDEPDISIGYRMALEDRGHEVVVSEDGVQCLEIYRCELKKIKPDIVRSISPSPTHPFDADVLDYRMPRKDGMEVAREILDINPHQRIIFDSAYVK